MKRSIRLFLPLILLFNIVLAANVQGKDPKFKVIAFYTGINDQAHVSFVHEANAWFSKVSALHHFSYEATNNWNNLNAKYLSRYQVVIFLDTRPDSALQRKAFQGYMERAEPLWAFISRHLH